MMVESRPEASRVLLHELAGSRRPGPGVEFLRSVLEQRVGESRGEAEKDRLAERQALAAIGLEVLGEPDGVSSLLRLGPDPRVRALLIHRLAATSLARQRLLDRLKDPGAEAGERQALLDDLGRDAGRQCPRDRQGRGDRTGRSLFQDDPDPGVHSAADLLLRRWGQGDLVAAAEARIRQRGPGSPPMRWLLGPEGLHLRRHRPVGRLPDGVARSRRTAAWRSTSRPTSGGSTGRSRWPPGRSPSPSSGPSTRAVLPTDTSPTIRTAPTTGPPGSTPPATATGSASATASPARNGAIPSRSDRAWSSPIGSMSGPDIGSRPRPNGSSFAGQGRSPLVSSGSPKSSSPGTAGPG